MRELSLAALAYDFAGTLLATLVGAVVALSGAYWLHRRESSERYDDAVDESVAMLVEEANIYRRDQADWNSRHFPLFLSSRPIGADPPPPDPAPSLAQFRALVDIASLRAKGDDRRVFWFSRDIVDYVDSDAGGRLGDRVVAISGLLVSWRELGETPEPTLRELGSLWGIWEHEDGGSAEHSEPAVQGDEGAV